MLGVTICNSTTMHNIDFDNVIEKVANISEIWYYRQLTLMGKMLIVNTLFYSMCTYMLPVLPLITNQQAEKGKRDCYKFLMEGEAPKNPDGSLRKQ